MSVSKIAQGIRLVLEGLGLNPEDQHLVKTPERAARALYWELCSGLTGERPTMTTFSLGDKEPEMIVLQDIPVKSLCSHHLLPFVGTATVGYLPGHRDKLLGLSKLSRIVDYYARRPQIQEELSNQIADDLWEITGWRSGEHPFKSWTEVAAYPGERAEDDPMVGGGVGVVIRARHFCMELRGVNHPGLMTTSALRGAFRYRPEVKAEFLALARER